MNHFEQQNDESKVNEYKELIVKHTRELMNNTDPYSKELEVKEIISVEILKIMQDQSAAKVLREILFDNDNKIDWNKAGNSIIENMPELKIFD